MRSKTTPEDDDAEIARLCTAPDPPSLEAAHLRASPIACALADEWAAECGYVGENVRDALSDAIVDALDALVLATSGSTLRKVGP